jgi:phytanoyl-CoA hydroxylase
MTSRISLFWEDGVALKGVLVNQSLKAQLNEVRDQYERDGYVVVKEAISRDLARESRNHVEWLIENNPGKRPEQLDHTLITDDPFWLRLVGDDGLLDVAEQFIGPDIALFASHYIAKPPRDGQPVLWHQDGSFWPLEPMEVVTLWLAADESTPENGCMRVIPGTHKMDLTEMQQNTGEANVLGAEIDPDLVDESQAVDLILEPGDVSIHHPNLIHGSEANRSSKWRRGLTIRYIPTSTRITQQPWEAAFLLRGEAVEGVNEYQPKPKYVEGRHMPFDGCEGWK